MDYKLHLVKEYLDSIPDADRVAELHGDELQSFVDWLLEFFTIAPIESSVVKPNVIVQQVTSEELARDVADNEATCPSRAAEPPPCPKCQKPMRQLGSKAPNTCWTCDCDAAEATARELCDTYSSNAYYESFLRVIRKHFPAESRQGCESIKGLPMADEHEQRVAEIRERYSKMSAGELAAYVIEGKWMMASDVDSYLVLRDVLRNRLDRPAVLKEKTK